jgi:(p)ppGpp synthase/HD superfamily hydrolase
MKFIKSEISNELLAASTKILDEKLSSFGLPPLNSKDDKISATIEKKDLDKQLIEALDNKTIYNKLAKQCYPREYHAFIKEKAELVANYTQKDQSNQTHNIIIDGNKLSNYTICPECNPQNMEKIIAKTGRDGIKIHGVNCKALKTIAAGNLLEAHWE